jgi:hypothetical protein
MSDQARFATAHPARYRHKVSLFALGFGLAAAPIAWAAQTILGYVLSSQACFPGDTPRSAPLFTTAAPMATEINIIAILVAAAAAAVAYRSWRATRDEGEGRVNRLVEIGEGRTRFLAACGILTSLGFLVAMMFSSLAILLVRLCGS